MPFAAYQPIAAIATTPSAILTLKPFCQASNAVLYVPQSRGLVSKPSKLQENVQFYQGSLKEHLETIWHDYKAFVFVLATGAVTRLIAPLLSDKSTDAAVLVVDEAGEFVISLCGGHQGGGDALTRLVAQTIQATPIITGASHSLNLPGIDILGLPFGWRKGSGDWTGVSAAIAKQYPVEVIQETGSTLWQNALPRDHPFQFQEGITPQGRVWIGFTQRTFNPNADIPKVQWHPRVLWVGLGCERGTPKSLIDRGLKAVFQSNHLAEAAIAGIATIDIKADEVGILQLCEERDFPLRTFSAEALKSVAVPTPSPVVDREVGTPSVAEAACLLGCGGLETKPVHLGLETKPVHLGLETKPLPSKPPHLLVKKQVYKEEGVKGAVTIAVSLAEEEFTGLGGKLFLVGTGPGALDQMTNAARSAVTEADVIIGYSLYLDLIAPLQRPGQIIESFPITRERDRAQRAIALAEWGLTVAVVSSGDCGIYGMAGLVMEELKQQDWDGKTPQVQVFPGITALQAAASRVGSPLMHDFCAISLSDLLTPWDVILKRLQAAAMGDFVTALYNPRSRQRQEQIVQAQGIFLQHRQGNTPVALVKSAYRPDEEIQITTLEQMLQFPIDMLTTVIIGNCSTYQHQDWLITPRGYLGKQ
ncbi:precorrin-3B C(17)-methyltransferase [Spirulina sp. 06S082]|uniref:precorrin-3B C(17)-methyltransferase n=1 Tax=Spirulina sp. 06S082 TaxID=3110248 RepID=UPI002B2114EA|nr:precorrin-3B C(17)-methyltransferase [Spirulina sp. 06S082]MEA5471240.1 precorrin-3B C(17)-methyltransferase [Spirulina sp. 06S082]